MTSYSAKIKSWTPHLEPEAFQQVQNVSKLPFIYKHVAVMPDAHVGKGSTIGTVIATKGAVSARDGQLGIITGSMGTKSYIVRGKGNVDSFYSCSHGAGRRMSRTMAKKNYIVKNYIVEDLRRQTQGVECRKDKNVIDEIPSAYKDINEVMNNQKDLVKIVYELKQVMCIKG